LINGDVRVSMGSCTIAASTKENTKLAKDSPGRLARHRARVRPGLANEKERVQCIRSCHISRYLVFFGVIFTNINRLLHQPMFSQMY